MARAAFRFWGPSSPLDPCSHAILKTEARCQLSLAHETSSLSISDWLATTSVTGSNMALNKMYKSTGWGLTVHPCTDLLLNSSQNVSAPPPPLEIGGDGGCRPEARLSTVSICFQSQSCKTSVVLKWQQDLRRSLGCFHQLAVRSGRFWRLLGNSLSLLSLGALKLLPV